MTPRSDYLNIGCGKRFLAHWENLDVRPADRSVRRWDVRRGLPYVDGRFSLVYLSHVLEHLPRSGAAALLRECRRVVRPNGILRVVVPDLEVLVDAYKTGLQAVRAGRSIIDAMDPHTAYDWACIDLLDQLTRTMVGGDMLARLADFEGRIPPALCERYGPEFIDGVSEASGIADDPPRLSRRIRTALRWRRRAMGARLRALGRRQFPGMADRLDRRRMAMYLQSGERHQWMYDDYSLSRLLVDCGFTDPVRLAFDQTRADDAADDIRRLDATPEGKPYKPRSIYMEGAK